MNLTNQTILDAVLNKAKQICPDSVALIGIYGSNATGDDYAKSDLDLLIVIDDEEGRKLASGFILEDCQVGYDLYCMNWERMQSDAECPDAHLARLMDSKIVYAKNEEVMNRLNALRERALQFLCSEERWQRANELLGQAKISYANAHLHESIGAVRVDASAVIYYLTNALMIGNGRYFQRGVKRTFDELAKLPIDLTILEIIQQIVASQSIDEIRKLLKSLLQRGEKCLQWECPKEAPSANLAGTYEEMFSNWRNKVEEAAERGDRFASFMNLCSLQNMLDEISAGVEIGTYAVMDEYDPSCLEKNLALYDRCLEKYEELYKIAGISVKRYPDAQAFAKDYIR